MAVRSTLLPNPRAPNPRAVWGSSLCFGGLITPLRLITVIALRSRHWLLLFARIPEAL